jgi:hypothetical protein
MKRIDSPIDAAVGDYESTAPDPVQAIILKAASALHPLLGLADAISDHFSTQKRFERIQAVLQFMSAEIEAISKKLEPKVIEERLHSPKFIEAVRIAAEEATRTAEKKKLDRLALALANGLNPKIIGSEEDLPGFIRDICQISESDIETLERVITTPSFFNFPRAITNSERPEISSFLDSMVESAAMQRMQKDDWYSKGYRLVGFGLVVPLQGTSSNEVSFAPTKSGQLLIELLTPNV